MAADVLARDPVAAHHATEAVSRPGLPVADDRGRRIGRRVAGADHAGVPGSPHGEPLSPVEVTARRPRRPRAQAAVHVATEVRRWGGVGAVDALRRRLEEPDLQRLDGQRRGEEGSAHGQRSAGSRQTELERPASATPKARDVGVPPAAAYEGGWVARHAGTARELDVARRRRRTGGIRQEGGAPAAPLRRSTTSDQCQA